MAKSAKTLVSIINWNNNRATETCLKGIAAIPKEKQPDVLLIDNDSRREPMDIKKSVLDKLRSIEIIKNPDNIGFAAAHNQSLHRALDAGYEYAVLLNNDTEIIDSGVFDKLTAALRSHDALAAAPTIVSDQHGTIWYAGGNMNLFSGTVAHKSVGQKYAAGGNVEQTSFISGCCLAVDLARFRKFGRFLPEDYFMYWEDADWSAQALAAGYKLLHVPDASILHHVSSSLKLASPRYVYYITRGNVFFINRNLGLLAKPFGYIAALVTSAKYFIKSLFGGGFGKTASALWKGWLHGILGRGGKI